MNNIVEDFKNAELALAAYANLSAGTPSINNLIDNGKGMSATQAADFASKYTVTQQFNSATGASATVFEEVATGKKYLAIRGTEGVTDYLADYVIINGIPSQLNPQYLALKVQVQTWLADPNVLKGQTFTVTGHSLGGYLAAGLVADFSANISHAYLYNAPGNNSHMSQVAQQLGWLTTPDASKITTLQADAGISPIAGLGNAFSPLIAISIENQFLSGAANPPAALNHSQQVLTDSLAVYNLLAKLAPSATLAQLTPMLQKASNVANRSLETMVEALAQTITGNKSTITTDNRDALYLAIKNLLAVNASGQPTGSFAALAGQVTLVNPATSATEARADFGAFLSLINLSPFALKTITSEAATSLKNANTTLSAQWTADNALTAAQRANGTATYSDMYLNDRAAMLNILLKRNAADAVGFVQGDTAAKYIDQDSNTAITAGPSLTESLTSRPQIIFGSNTNGLGNETQSGGDQADHLYGMGGNDILNGGIGNDYLEGGDGADKLNGDSESDTLYGGLDADTLTGGTGTDYLYGGQGNDTYVHADGDGNDVITDSDGLGKLQTATGKILNGGTAKGTNYWYSTEQETGYALYHNGDGTDTLNIYLKNGERLFVKNWQAGQLGITLPGETPVTAQALTNDSDFYEAKTNAAVDAGTGNDVLIASTQEVTLKGGAGNDLILGYGNGIGSPGYNYMRLKSTAFPNQTVALTPAVWKTLNPTWQVVPNSIGEPTSFYQNNAGIVTSYYISQWKITGTDATYGEVTAMDFTYAFTNFDVGTTPKGETLYGGSGNDLISGSVADDYISGDEDDDLLYGNAGHDHMFGGAGKDFLFGGNGNDYIDGGTEDDDLNGGYGADYLMGGAGNDYLFADVKRLLGTEAPPEATYYSTTGPDILGDDTLDGGAGNDTLFGGARANTLYGGIGNDQLSGDGFGFPGIPVEHQGNDLLDGGEGDDKLWGDGGHDTLYGGSGNDYLEGDYSTLAASSHGNDLLDGGAGDDTLFGQGGADTLYGGTGKDTLDGGEGDDILNGEEYDDYLIGAAGNDYLNGGADKDTLVGGVGDDTLYGGSGDDVIEGGVGNDVLYGGLGTDNLKGGAGNDTYIMDTGESLVSSEGNAETIDDTEGSNTVTFGAGLMAQSVVASVDSTGQYLVIGNAGSDQLYIKNGMTGAVQQYQFANGDTLNAAAMMAKTTNNFGFYASNIITDFAVYGGGGNATLYTGSGNNLLDGQGGDDYLSAGAGNDTLIGGAGNDNLNGGDGADTYLFGIGSGQDTINNYDADAAGLSADTIELGAGITTAGVTLTRNSDSLKISINGTADSVEVSGYFSQDGAAQYAVETIKFADNTLWNVETVKAKVLLPTAGDDTINGYASNDNIQGADGNDLLYGNAGNDTLNGGNGNDFMMGGDGADTYLFGIGSGQDTINNYDNDALSTNVDTIQLGAGITAADVTISRNWNNGLVLSIKGTTDRLEVNYYFNQETASPYALETIRFADGTSWNTTAVKAKLLIGTAGNDNITGYSSNDSISGGDGNDLLYGNAGNDSINGDVGNDYLYGDDGNDVLNGGNGNDYLSGGNGTDTYIFGIGSGQDTIDNNDSDLLGTNIDTLQLGAGITATNLSLSRIGNDLTIRINGTTDSMAITSYFNQDGASQNALESIKFADNSIWNVDTVKAKVLLPTSGNDTISGYAGNESIAGGDGNDSLSGNDGNDTLNGGNGNDILNGGNGSDVYQFGIGGGQDSINNMDLDGLGLKADTIQFGSGITQNDIIVGRSFDDLVLTINGYPDRLTVSNYFANDATLGYAVEKINFVNGDVWNIDTIKAKALLPSVNSDVIKGYASNDSITGGIGNETIYGNNGNDTLDGGVGRDTLVGGNGADVYRFNIGSGYDVINNDDSDPVGTNLDTLELGAGITTSNMFLGRLNNDLSITVKSSLESIFISNYFLNGGTSSYALNNIKFADGQVWNTSTVMSMLLQSTAGDDNLLAFDSNDTLDGGLGNDTLRGGTGNDTYVFGIGYGKDVIIESGSTVAETDTVALKAGITPANVSLFMDNNDLVVVLNGSSTQLRVSGNILLFGNTSSAPMDYSIERITFADGTIWNKTDIQSKTFSGTVNSMAGSAGNDIYLVDNSADAITEASGAGTDTVNSSVSYWLPDNVENLTATGIINSVLQGNHLNNVITGNDSDNILNTGIGLYKGSSYTYNYWLGGEDRLVGGKGDDTYYVNGIDLATSSYYSQSTNDTVVELANEGNDTIYSNNFYYALPENVEILIDQYFYGTWYQGSNTFVRSLIGNNANNTISVQGGPGVANPAVNLGGFILIDGGLGADTMVGSYEDTTYIIDNAGDVVRESILSNNGLNNSIDTIKSSITFDMTNIADIENLTLTGTTSINATGNAGSNTLSGNSGSNVLDGKTGADTMIGGAGNDTYMVDNTGDVVTELANEGTDTVQSSISYTLGTTLEHLTLTGSAAINATGNASNNALTGNASNNILDGKGGDDTMVGGLGDDTYLLDSTGDIITELANQGNDTLQVVAENNTGGVYGITLGTGNFANIENLIVTGGGLYDLFGDSGNNLLRGNISNNTLTGNAGNDTLEGGIGNDTMIGGTGNDLYLVDSAADVISENANEGNDTIQVVVDYAGTDAFNVILDTGSFMNVENLIVTASGLYNLGGNTGNNWLRGNGSNNLLHGFTGNDILQGMGGDDTLINVSGNTLLDAGLGNDSLTGGTGSDILIGGKGNDTITTDSGYDVISFNKGDGQDIVNVSTGADNTISLGGSFAYSDLSLSKTGNDLLLKVGTTDQITLKDWYAATANKSVINLQIIAEAVTGFSLGSSDALRNNKIENFNFANLVAAYDTAGNPASWALTDTILTAHLKTGSDSAAIGGDLAYQYGMNGNLTGIGLLAAQGVMNAATVGQSAQTLNSPTTWQSEAVKLG